MPIKKPAPDAAFAEATLEPKEKKRRPPAPDSWAALRQTLRTWEAPQLLGLVHDLFENVPEARAAIVGRLTIHRPASARKGTLDQLRAKVRRAVRPTASMLRHEPNLRAARQIGDQYLRATSDADGTISLYVELVESAMHLSFEFGWGETAFYDSIDRAAAAAAKIMPAATDATLLSDLAQRVRALLRHDNFPGWGMGDTLLDLAEALEQQAKALSEPQA